MRIFRMFVFPLFILTIFSLCVENSRGQDEEKEVDFAQLRLDINSLRGARWQAEYKGQITVFHSIDIVDISKVNVDTMSLRVEFHMRQRWVADNLTFPDGLFKKTDANGTMVYADEDVLQFVWSPDSYLPNARDTQIAKVSTTESVVSISNDKTIIYSARLYSVLGCQFTFQWYPLDKQNCDLIFESYAWPSNKVRYQWEPTAAVTISNVKLLQYELIIPFHSNGTTTRFGRSETYAFVNLRFSFERQLEHHMIQVFTPTTLIVILSWFSFWLGLDAVPGRISLLITCMLTLVTMHTGLKGDLPPVNYIKMLDIWMVSCMGFVFAALSEFIVVKYMQWMTQQRQKDTEAEEVEQREHYRQMSNPKLFHEKQSGIEQRPVLAQRMAWETSTFANSANYFTERLTTSELGAAYKKRKNQTKNGLTWETIDRVSRVLFPVLFLVFLCIFWPILFIGAASQQ